MSQELDHTDLVILDIIQRNPRVRHKDIAKLTHKSTSRIFDRVKRLEQEGYIKKIVAILDQKLIDKNLVAFALIKLKEHSKKTLLNFGGEIGELEEVMEAYHMSGECDFLLKVAVADMGEYNQFVVKQLSGFTQIASIKSWFVMREVKNENVYQL
jgi:Lrp/AsnC family transcriptional regulator, leucine-responsive regulatory protein